MGDGKEAREGWNIHVVMADLHYLQQKPTQHYVLQLKIKKQKALQNGKRGRIPFPPVITGVMVQGGQQFTQDHT